MDIKIEDALQYVLVPQPYDEKRYLEAGTILVNNRDKLTHKVFYKIPDPGALVTNNDPKWETIKEGSSGERCGCGNCRTIWPSHLPEFKEGETVTLNAGDKIYIVPKGSHYRHTELMVEIVSDSGRNMLHFVMDPFSDSFNFSELFHPKGYNLAEIALALGSKEGREISLKRPLPKGVTDKDEITLFRIKVATAESITLVVGDGYVVSKDPEADGEKPVDINPVSAFLIEIGE